MPTHDVPPPLPGTRKRGPSDVCPYCGAVIGTAAECGTCGGLTEPLSKQASQNAMGPWFVRSAEQPFLPGCSLRTLRRMAERGRVTRETVVRGPSTRQFWMRAERTPGLANVLGVCHACGSGASAADAACGACGASFTVDDDRDRLGLSPVRWVPGMGGPAPAPTAGPPSSPEANVPLSVDPVADGSMRGRAIEVPVQSDAGPVPLAEEALEEPAEIARARAEAKARRLLEAEMEARQALLERRERERGRQKVIVAGVVVLVVCAIALALAMIPSGGGAGGVGGAGAAGAGGAAGTGAGAGTGTGPNPALGPNPVNP